MVILTSLSKLKMCFILTVFFEKFRFDIFEWTIEIDRDLLFSEKNMYFLK